MKEYIYPLQSEWDKLIERPTASYDDLEDLVSNVFEQIKTRGDDAIFEYTNEFDKVQIHKLQVDKKEILDGVNNVPKDLKNAIQKAKNNIEKFHKAQITKTVKVETQPGVKCWQKKQPIEKVGLYIPGGSAPLFSSILMLAIPAQIAGCNDIILCSPPNSQGKLPKELLYTAQLCGVTKIFKVGGIQAIAGMTFGTESITNVYKIFGPGNQ